MSTVLSRRAALISALFLPACIGSPAVRAVDPKAPKCIAWPAWAGHDRAGQVMTPAELAQRYAGNASKLRYALRRLARYEARR
jgi:hypothetical protein